MKQIEDMLHSIGIVIDKATVITYIELNWVRPIYKNEEYYFEDIDMARIRLIHQFKETLLIEDSAIDIILSLVDQLYGTRHQLNKVCVAISAQPKPIQKDILSLLEKLSD